MRLSAVLRSLLSEEVVEKAIKMYGGMGGGGNAWMKIMGISGDAGKRKGKEKDGKGTDGKTG